MLKLALVVALLLPQTTDRVRDRSAYRGELCRLYRGWQAAFERARDDAMEGRTDVSWNQYVAMKEGNRVESLDMQCGNPVGSNSD